MAQILIEGFADFDTPDLAANFTQVTPASQNTPGSGSSIAIDATAGRDGTPALKLVGNGNGSSGSISHVPTNPAPSGATAIFGFRLKCLSAFTLLPTATDESCALLACRKSGTTQWWLRPNPNGTISVFRGTTLLGTTGAALVQGARHYVEVKVLLHGSAGTVDVRIDGFNVLSLTGLNTQGAGVSTWDEFRLGPVTTNTINSGSTTWLIQDLYVADGSGATWTTFMGDQRMDTRRVTANGHYAAFTPSAGSNYQNVDDALADGDGTYNASSTVGARDSFVCEDVLVAGAIINGIQIKAQIRKTDAGAAGHTAFVRIGGVDYDGHEVAVPSGYAFVREQMPVSPATGVAWTESEANGMEPGYLKSS